MASYSSADGARTDQYREKALSHAQDLEHQKSMQNNVLDFILELVDLPSKPNADPARPLASDAALFKRGLHVFQPSDFDDLILERNIYDKCGYGLCGQQNVKVTGNAQNRVIWGKRSGPAFTVVPKRDLEKWCSKECEERAVFVRVQLGKEPAWLRDQPIADVKLLDEVRQEREGDALATNIADDVRKLALDRVERYGGKDEVAERLQALSLERGEPQKRSTAEMSLHLVEKAETQKVPQAPQLSHKNAGTVEGYRPKKVRFVARGNVDGDDESDDSDIDIDDRDSDDDEDAMSV